MQTIITEALIPADPHGIAPAVIQEVVLSERNLKDLWTMGAGWTLTKQISPTFLLRVRIEADDLHYGDVVDNALRA